MRNLMNIIKSFFLQATLVLAFFGVAITSLYGVRLTEKTTNAVGHFRTESIPTGVSIFQYDIHAAYEASAYNDYTIDAARVRRALIPFTQPATTVTALPLTTTRDPKFMFEMQRRLQNFLGKDVVHSRFSHDGVFDYQIEAIGQRLNLVHTVRGFMPAETAQIWGTTLSFSRDDLVFDANGNLYTENPDSESRMLANIIGKQIIRHDSSIRRTQIAGKTLYIINPRVPGVLVVYANSLQTMFINKDYRLIELEEPATEGKLKFEMVVEILENL